MTLTVSVFGSCRVFTPVNRLARRGLIKTAHRGIEWYTHTTRDMLQKLKVVRNQMVVAPEDVPLIAETHAKKWFPDHHRKEIFAQTDLFVVEICSRKIFAREGVYYQQWCYQEAEKDPAATEAMRHRLATTVPRQQSAAEIRGDMELMRQRLGKPVLFVGHMDVVLKTGKKLPDRGYVNRAMAEYCAGRRDAFYFDPIEQIQEYGIETALMDSSHYREEFMDTVGDKLFAAMEQLVAGHKAEPMAAAE